MVVAETCHTVCCHLMLDLCGICKAKQFQQTSRKFISLSTLLQVSLFAHEPTKKRQEAIDLHISTCKRSCSKSLPREDSEASDDDDSLTKEEFEEFKKTIDAAAKAQEPMAATKDRCPKCFQYECKCFST